MSTVIDTNRLRLVSCSREMLEAVIAGDDAIGKLLRVNAATPWTMNEESVFRFSMEKISAHPDEEQWWTYLHILKRENLLTGCCGFKGKPDKNGMVEIGYEVARDYRLQGLATEIARALIEFSFSDEAVKTVIAHTLAEENASNRVLRKCGMTFASVAEDPDEGKVWRWEIAKPASTL